LPHRFRKEWIAPVAIGAVIGIVGVAWSQTSPPAPDGIPAGSFWDELWRSGERAGPFASMLLLAILVYVNNERRETQKKLDVLVDRFIAVAGNMSATLNDFRDVFKGAFERKPPP
jgi:hypothetical protein